jgi:FKBP-type peptidyl-prolyl cis-trans isomerase FkpA
MRPIQATVLCCVILLAAGAAHAAGSSSSAGAGPKFKSEDDKTLYAMGVMISQQLKAFSLSDAELDVVKSGLADGARGKTGGFNPEEYGGKIRELQTARAKSTAERERTQGKAFIEKAAAEQGATKTASGAVYKVTQEGTGDSPKATDQVKVNYEGRLIDGTVFDSSIKRGQPATFPLNRVIPCWTEGVQLMKAGGKSRLVCPAELAYGDRGTPTIPPGATLVFDVELLEVLPPLPPPAAGAPPAPATPPAGAAPASKPAAPASKPK